MENNLVRYSRAGDVFHYRWAARRCLRLIYPNSFLKTITIEGSKESSTAGEYVIDVAEYSSDIEKKEKINYYQLKHTTVRLDKPFVLSDLKDTFEGFSARFKDLYLSLPSKEMKSILFTLLTNRPVADNLKSNISKIKDSQAVDARFKSTLEKYTGLSGDELKMFCTVLTFEDGEGDYIGQRYELHLEINQILAGMVDTPQVDSIIALVQEKALPDSNGEIAREDILKRFGIYSERQLYPAPPIWEPSTTLIERNNTETIRKKILLSDEPIIVHAAAGVGKSVFSRQLVTNLPLGYHGLVYDCFGSGRYRNRSETRHMHRQALVQITNELATMGLCAPMLVQQSTQEEEVMRTFLLRMESSIEALKRGTKEAKLVIVIDAADNAEMAAYEFNQSCFASELLREKLPANFVLVAVCRTERINLLSPLSTILKIELQPFSKEESYQYLLNFYPDATIKEAIEFHQLTNGNPRVQANSVNDNTIPLHEILMKLGPIGTKVEDQIRLQLENAISKIKDQLPPQYKPTTDAICMGLASLPPLIPLDVLAKVAKVDEQTIKSFITDIGRPIWLSESFIRFTDEPTETWFRQTFAAKKEDFEDFVKILKPLAGTSSYISESLPLLLLQAEQYRELITLALSENYLPTDNPIDARNIRIYRLQFAFKAALKTKQYPDAIKIAIRAGEEMAGDHRQLEVLRSNIDILSPLLSNEKVKEIAFRGLLRSHWAGSENIFSASLLSTVTVFEPEARSYLRAAEKWIVLHNDEKEKANEFYHQNDIPDDDMLEVAFTILNIEDAGACVRFLIKLHPVKTFFVVQMLSRRLVDQNNFSAISQLLDVGVRYPLFVLAITNQLLEVGVFPDKHITETCLLLLSYHRFNRRKSLPLQNESIMTSMISFAEISYAQKLSTKHILRILKRHLPSKATESMSGVYQTAPRDIFLRSVSLKNKLLNKLEFNIEQLLPERILSKDQKNTFQRDLDDFKQVFGALLPWYKLRLRILAGENVDGTEQIAEANRQSSTFTQTRYKQYDSLPSEIARIKNSILILNRNLENHNLEIVYQQYFSNRKEIWVNDRLNLIRAAFRLDHLKVLREKLQYSLDLSALSSSDERPEVISERFVGMARAVLPMSKDEAAAYFDKGIEIVSKFGDEIAQRWKSVTALAERSSDKNNDQQELAFRFIRCAELVGDYVDREKYWDRNEAIKICLQLSPSAGIAAFSRWRDRRVGWFDNQIEFFSEELLKAAIISPSEAWSLSCFYSNQLNEQFADLCMDAEQSPEVKIYILKDAVETLRKQGASLQIFQNLAGISKKHEIEYTTLLEIVDATSDYAPGSNNKIVEKETIKDYALQNEKWDKIFIGLDLYSASGINSAFDRFENQSFENKNALNFWHKLPQRVEGHLVVPFIEAVFASEHLEISHLHHVLNVIPTEWKQKVSYIKNWHGFISKIGKRYATELTDAYYYRYLVKDLCQNSDDLSILNLSILEGLSTGMEISNASTFFGLIRTATSFVTGQQASNLTTYALSRFEIHIEDQYADGKWNDKFILPVDNTAAVAGFVWSALGAPDLKTRWNAVHCVRKLVELNCAGTVNALVDWMVRDSTDSFGSNKFPFYNLHARQHLLIAFSRISLDNPAILMVHHKIFIRYALYEDHVLMQKFACDVINNIERFAPGTYDTSTLELIRNAGEDLASATPTLNDQGLIMESSIKRENVKFGFSHDFDRYWHAPLGNVFGISSDQIEEMAWEVIFKEWKLKDYSGGYDLDPRSYLWNKTREQETWHRKEEYPDTDNLDFYLSYHSLMVVAAKLVKEMHLNLATDKKNYSWNRWLQRHLLTRPDGKWLSDLRDAVPIQRPEWVNNKTEQSWLLNLSAAQIIEHFTQGKESETWITVSGYWQERNSERTESYTVSSALVSKGAALSLMRALQTCPDPYDFKLPDYQEEDAEINSGIFRLTGWIDQIDGSKRRDKDDPAANDIRYPPNTIGLRVARKLKLSSDKDYRNWFVGKETDPVLTSRTWRSFQKREDQEPDQTGQRLSARLSFLKYLCLKLDCEIIIEVGVTRKLTDYSENENNSKRFNQIYLLSADGTLRSTDANNEFR